MAFAKRTILLFFLIAAWETTSAQNLEYFAKASYIEKFARFTEWPAEARKDTFIIMVYGKSPIEAALGKLAKKYTIKNKPISVKYISNIDDAGACNILFIAPSEKNNLNRLLSIVQNKHILTVGESDGFCKKGVHLNFYNTPEGSIYFEINPSKIKMSGLRVDMYMMEFGKVIN